MLCNEKKRCRLYECDDIEESERGWKTGSQPQKKGIPALVHFAEIKEKIAGTYQSCKTSISTGKLEGFNNKIKVAKELDLAVIGMMITFYPD